MIVKIKNCATREPELNAGFFGLASLILDCIEMRCQNGFQLNFITGFPGEAFIPDFNVPKNQFDPSYQSNISRVQFNNVKLPLCGFSHRKLAIDREIQGRATHESEEHSPIPSIVRGIFAAIRQSSQSLVTPAVIECMCLPKLDRRRQFRFRMQDSFVLNCYSHESAVSLLRKSAQRTFNVGCSTWRRDPCNALESLEFKRNVREFPDNAITALSQQEMINQ